MAYKDWRNGHSEIPGCPCGEELKNLLTNAICVKPRAIEEFKRVNPNDLPSVAEFYVYFEGGSRGEMEEVVKTAIQAAKSPRPIHWVLASLPSVRCIFTTNYDDLVEVAASQVRPPRNILGPWVYNQSSQEQVKPEGIPMEIISNKRFHPEAAQPPHPLVLYKMHGCVRCDDSLLITTYDYVKYIASWRDEHLGMPKTFRDLLLKNSILFLGYGLGDWNFRVMWETMIASFPGGRFPIQSYAIKKGVTNFESKIFAMRNIQLIDCDITLFAQALAEEFGVAIPAPPSSIPNGKPLEDAGI